LPHSGKRWINEYHWQRNQRIEKKLAPISSGCSRWKSLKGNVIYIDHFGNIVNNITKEYFNKIAKEDLTKLNLKTKNIKTILPNYSAIATSDKYPIKSYEGKNYIFNEAGFLEIAIFRSNPSNGDQLLVCF
jgi:S-adenosylmethionine hydrolase